MNIRRFEEALFAKRLRQYALCRDLGWFPSKLSGIKNGHWPVSQYDGETLAKALDVPLGELFPELADGKSKNQSRRRRVVA